MSTADRLPRDQDAPWLVVVDPQRIFADPASDWASPFFPQAMGRIGSLAAHVGPERTVVTRWLPTARRRTAQGRATSWDAYFRAWPFADVAAEDPLYELVDAARGLSAHPTVDEPTFGKWGARLRRLVGEAPQLLVTGVSTDCCVIATVLPAADAGAHVTVVTDAVAHSTAEDGAAALHAMSLFSPQVVLRSTAEVTGDRDAATGMGPS